MFSNYSVWWHALTVQSVKTGTNSGRNYIQPDIPEDTGYLNFRADILEGILFPLYQKCNSSFILLFAISSNILCA